jgi:hypothetical protein
MIASMQPDTWLRFIRQEYVGPYIPEGGSAVKFCVPLEAAAREALLAGIASLVSETGYLFARVDSTRTKIHLMDHVFFRIADQVDWRWLCRSVLANLCKQEGYEPPQKSKEPFYQRVADANRIDPDFVKMELRRKLVEAVFKRYELTKDFRVAMMHLCLAELIGGNDGDTTSRIITQWLTGRNKLIGAVKPYQIFNTINRTNARHLFESLLKWVKFAGLSGALILVDVAQLTEPKRSQDDLVHYTPSALLDAYELLRQFVDSTDRLMSCLLIVMPDVKFLDEDVMGRGIGRYQALKFRVFDEVRAKDVVNPMGTLVRLSLKAPEAR